MVQAAGGQGRGLRSDPEAAGGPRRQETPVSVYAFAPHNTGAGFLPSWRYTASPFMAETVGTLRV